jgi:hypothetical protein
VMFVMFVMFVMMVIHSDGPLYERIFLIIPQEIHSRKPVGGIFCKMF